MAPASLISLNKTTIHHNNVVKPLDFDKPFSTLPPTHQWPPINGNETETNNNNSQTDSIPVIDLSESNPLIREQLREASEGLGAFLVINHGVPLKFLEEFESQTRALFSLPSENKFRTLRHGQTFSTGYGMVPISKFFPQKMWSEGFAIVGSPSEHDVKLWPPHGNPQFCAVMEEYQKQLKALAEKILSHMFPLLGISQKDLNWATESDPYGTTQSLLHLNSYPPCPDPDHTLGMAQHTDSSLLTIVYQNTVPGLQFLRENNHWLEAPSLPGTLVVNVGDLLQIVSNGRFKSAPHRVVVNRTSHRYTASYFYSPPRQVEICPIVDGIDHLPLYRSVSWEEYLELKSIHFNNTLKVVQLDFQEASVDE